ncbi:MAG: GGDEF domain-containing protein [Acidobacteriaceae bacterium]
MPEPQSLRSIVLRWTTLLSLLAIPVCLPGQTTAHPLTTIAAVRNLPYAEAAKSLPVRVTGVITYNGFPDADMFIQDRQSWIYILPNKLYNIPPGSLVEVIGKSSAGYTTQIEASSIRLLAPGHLPHPVLLNYAHALLHQNDCRYISLEGTIRAASFQSSGGVGIYLLQLESHGRMVDVAVSDFPNFDPARLLDARVRVAGVVGGTFDATEERIVGLRLNVNSASAITFLSPLLSESFPSTTISVADLLLSNESLRPWHRVITTGTVTLYDPGELLVIQDGTSALLIHTRQVDNLFIGQRVSVTGFAAATEGATTMELGQFTPLPARGAPVSRPITFADAMTGLYTNRLLTLDGTVISQTRENHAHILFLRSGNQTLQVVFRKRTHDPDPIPYYPPGTSLRVTGVCAVHFRGFWGEVENFQLRIRSPADLAVLRPASWWTLGHLFIVTSAVLGLALVALAWGLILRRRLLAHETLLRQKSELEATRLSTAARLERERSHILELINSFQPLPEVLSAIQACAEEMWPGTLGYTHVLVDRMLLLTVGPGLSPAELLRLQTIDPSLSPEICALAVRSRGLTGHPEGGHLWSRPILSSRGEILGTMTFCSRNGAPLPLHNEAFEFGCNLAAIAIDNRRLYEDMLHRSRHDQLTGLPNRSVVEECLEEALRKAAENHSFAALLYLDLDDFKSVNDSFTHRVGDSYLIEVSHRFRACLRSGDIIGRIGGDEFVAVLTELEDPTLARVIADRLVHAMEAPFLIEHHLIRGSVSIGLAIYPSSGQSAMSITHLADQAMYAAKRAGGNRICSSDVHALYQA